MITGGRADGSAGGGPTPSSASSAADKVDGGSESDTLTLAATSSDLNAALNGELVSVEAVSAALAAAAVTIDLGIQSDGFTITGSAQATRSRASSAARRDRRRAGADTIVGFVGGGHGRRRGRTATR